MHSLAWPLEGIVPIARPDLRRVLAVAVAAVVLAVSPASNAAGDAHPPIVVAALITPQSPEGQSTPSSAAVTEANALLQRREYDKALTAAEKVIQNEPRLPVGFNIRGAAYLGKDDLDNARKSFEEALRLAPDSTIVLLNLMQVDWRRKNYAAARAWYEAALKVKPDDVMTLLIAAKFEASTGNPQKAIALIERAQIADPASYAPQLAMAGVHMQSKEYPQALADLKSVERSLGGNASYLELLGQLQIASGRTADAVATYRRLTSVRPKSAAAWSQLAAAQLALGERTPATASLKRALELEPRLPDALAMQAALDLGAGRTAQALTSARVLQDAAPKDLRGFVLEGNVLMAQQRPGDALAAYERAWALSQNDALAMKVHAAETAAGKPDADDRLLKWVNAHPDSVSLKLYVADWHMRAGRVKPAIDAYEAVLRVDSRNPIALNNLAQLYRKQKDPRALEFAENAYTLMPQSPTIADTLGWMLIEDGDTARGLKLLEKAAINARDNAEIRYHLAFALAKSGDKARARKELTNLLSSTPKFAQRDAAEALLRQMN